MKTPRHASYPMPLEEREELARELSEFGYRETDDPDEADRRNFYKVEKWDATELHVVELLHASNDLSRAKEVFAAEKKRRPRGRYTLRQRIRVLERWPPPAQQQAATSNKSNFQDFYSELREEGRQCTPQCTPQS
jgi:hypothetical protein